MTDAERLAQIREFKFVRTLAGTEAALVDTLRLLDEARAAYLQAAEAAHRLNDEVVRLRSDANDIAEELMKAQDEIARLKEANSNLQRSLDAAHNEAVRQALFPGNGGWR